MKKNLSKRLLYVLVVVTVVTAYRTYVRMERKKERDKMTEPSFGGLKASMFEMKNLIVGLWEHKSNKVTLKADGAVQEQPQDERVFFQFTPDGKITLSLSEEDSPDVENPIKEGTYSLSDDGKQLTIQWESEDGIVPEAETVGVWWHLLDGLFLVREDDRAIHEMNLKKVPVNSELEVEGGE